MAMRLFLFGLSAAAVLGQSPSYDWGPSLDIGIVSVDSENSRHTD